MAQKIAVAVIHGVGRQEKNFADGIMAEVTERFSGLVGDSVAEAGTSR